MKRIMMIGLPLLALFILAAGNVTGQNRGNPSPAVLYVFEESNENIDPWNDLFQKKLRELGYTYDAAAAGQMNSVSLEKYSHVIIHGAVMAFASKEPVRDWLKTGPNLSGKRIVLFVTANRWFLGKYFNQLLSLLGERGAEVVDSVSSATKDLTAEEKAALVDQVVRVIGSR